MAPMTAKSKKVKLSWEFLESASWFHQMVSKRHQNQERLLKRFEATYLKYEVDQEREPINILCLEAGGMRGYALFTVLSIIEEKYGGEEGIDILQYFDLFAGTSIGGAFAVSCNVMKNLRGAIDETVDAADDIRERTFGKFNVGELLKTGSLVSKKDQIEAVVKERWGDRSFSNPSGPPAMVLCTLKHDCFIRKDHDEEEANKFEYEPYVLRTYEYPYKNTNDNNTVVPTVPSSAPTPSNEECPIVNSSSSLKMYEAVAATTAMPLVTNRVNIQVDGNLMSLADGCLFGNCPIAIAIDEARCLYPSRPLGVILSTGVNDDREDRLLIEQAINTAKVVNPQLHFQRIIPHDICIKFLRTEPDLDKIAMMEEQVREYVEHDEKVVIELDETMKKLSNQCRSRPQFIIEEGSVEQSHRNMMLKSHSYQERSQRRSKIAGKRNIATVISPQHRRKTQDEHASCIPTFDEDGDMSLESVPSTNAVILTTSGSSWNDFGGQQEPKISSGDSWKLFKMCLSCFKKDLDTGHVQESEE